MNVFDRQFLQNLIKFSPGVPMGALVRALAAISTFVEPRQAVPVEQSKYEHRRVTRTISAIARSAKLENQNLVRLDCPVGQLCER